MCICFRSDTINNCRAASNQAILEDDLEQLLQQFDHLFGDRWNYNIWLRRLGLRLAPSSRKQGTHFRNFGFGNDPLPCFLSYTEPTS
mmetsp:Transcript_11157/g.13199  ORF Transcript_11157/g.13199 Transcript_11157/m.13199 type:complete len:87 (-) Transcript_11157:12-272(-)